MYNINPKVRYFIYDLYTKTYAEQFESEEELINFLVKKTYKSYWHNTYQNHYLDNIAMNCNDVGYSFDDKTLTGKESDRRYFFIDSYDRIFDARKYWPVLKERYNENAYLDLRVSEDAKRGDKYYCYVWRKEGLYSFRNGPVPGIHKIRGYNYIRSPHTTRELRDNCNDKYINFVRGKRKKLPTLYDDIAVTSNKSKSWKDCTKKEKQWIKRHT